MSELKPCPFCNDDFFTPIVNVYEEGCQKYRQVFCPGCGARGPIEQNNSLDSSAEEKWNTRTEGER